MKYNLPDIAYTPRGWMYVDVEPSAIKKEYQRLRKVANERLRKLKKAGYSDLETYKRFKSSFPSYTAIKTNTALGIHLADVRHFLGLETSTVGGINKLESQTIQRLHESGYTFINKENLKAFGEFMDAVRAKYSGLIYGSDQVVDLFGASIEKKLEPMQLLKDFDYWQNNVYELEYSRQKRNDLNTPENYKKIIERRKKRHAKSK